MSCCVTTQKKTPSCQTVGVCMQRGRAVLSLKRKRKTRRRDGRGKTPFSHAQPEGSPPLRRSAGLRSIGTEKSTSRQQPASRDSRSGSTEKTRTRASSKAAAAHTEKKREARRAQKNWGTLDGHAPEPSQPPGDGGRHAYLFHGTLTVLPLGAVYAPGNGEVYPETRHERNLSRSAGKRDVLLHISNLNLN